MSSYPKEGQGTCGAVGSLCAVTERLHLSFDGPIAIITNDNPEKHNAFDDEMDLRLFDILGEITQHPEVRAVIWRGEGKSFSSGRDVGSIGNLKVELSHHDSCGAGIEASSSSGISTRR